MGARVFTSGVTLGGLDLSGVDAAGVDWKVDKVAGWSGSPASTLQLVQKAGRHGAWASSRPRRAARILTIEGTISGAPNDVSAAIDQLNTVAALDPVRIVVDEGGRSRWAMVQRQDEVIVDDAIAASARYSLQLAQPDPNKYGTPLSASTGLPATSGGLAVPFGVPFGIASTVVSGQVSLANTGNADGPVTLRIDGPIVGPTVTHLGSGLALTFASSLTLGVGEWLDVDMQARTVLANGTASRAGWITSRGWSVFEPGGNTWALTAAAPSPTARLTVTATPAWQ